MDSFPHTHHTLHPYKHLSTSHLRPHTHPHPYRLDKENPRDRSATRRSSSTGSTGLQESSNIDSCDTDQILDDTGVDMYKNAGSTLSMMMGRGDAQRHRSGKDRESDVTPSSSSTAHVLQSFVTDKIPKASTSSSSSSALLTTVSMGGKHIDAISSATMSDEATLQRRKKDAAFPDLHHHHHHQHVPSSSSPSSSVSQQQHQQQSRTSIFLPFRSAGGGEETTGHVDSKARQADRLREKAAELDSRMRQLLGRYG